jgi:hypothetical protein
LLLLRMIIRIPIFHKPAEVATEQGTTKHEWQHRRGEKVIAKWPTCPSKVIDFIWSLFGTTPRRVPWLRFTCQELLKHSRFLQSGFIRSHYPMNFAPSICHLSYIYIYLIYTPNLGSPTAVSVWEKEQGRFNRARKGPARERRGSKREQKNQEGARESKMEQQGAARGHYLNTPRRG